MHRLLGKFLSAGTTEPPIFAECIQPSAGWFTVTAPFKSHGGPARLRIDVSIA